MICEPWTTEAEVAACNCEPGAVSPERLAGLIDSATETLYLLSGSQFSGTCVTKLRPCSATGGGPVTTPALIDGEWWNLGGCGCSTWNSCTCGRAQPLLLPYDYPTAATVLIDGAEVTDFRLDGRTLWRAAGWPCCQNLALPDTEPGTWSVTVTHGLPAPASGRAAAAALTAELVRACTADKTCRLPLGASTVVRQGVTIDSAEFAAMLRVGAVGIAEIDLFLAATNPHGLRQRARFVSPDVPATAG